MLDAAITISHILFYLSFTTGSHVKVCMDDEAIIDGYHFFWNIISLCLCLTWLW